MRHQSSSRFCRGNNDQNGYPAKNGAIGPNLHAPAVYAHGRNLTSDLWSMDEKARGPETVD